MDVYIVLIEDTHINPPEVLVFTNRQRALTVAEATANEQAESYGMVAEIKSYAPDADDEDGYEDVLYYAQCCEDPVSDVWVLKRELDSDDTLRT